MATSKQGPRGFTIVELLTVVVIIAVLAALLVPAVMHLRNRAQTTRCVNNEHQISVAIFGYVTAKGHFPGWVNPALKPLPPPDPVVDPDTEPDEPTPIDNVDNRMNWVASLLPYLGRDDLWNEVRDSDGKWAAYIDEMVCPLDKDFEGAKEDGVSALSYVVNIRICMDRSSGGTENDIWLDDIVTRPASETVLLGDRMGSGPWTSKDSSKLTFTWGKPGDPLSLCLPSNHDGVANITFCDGHTATVRDDTDCETYSGVP